MYCYKRKIFITVISYFFLIFYLCFFSPSAYAQAIPELTSVFPQGGQRGSSVELTFNGQNLAEATSILFSGSGVSGQLTTPEATKVAVVFSGKGISGQVASSSSFSAKITIAPDAPVGNRELRLVTPNGVSNSLTFVVGDLPETKETEPNNALSQANQVILPLTINGRIDPAEDWDYFSFAAQKGQRLIFEVYASRLDSPLDSFLVLYNAQGKELTINEDANRSDSLIDYTILETGDYVIQVRDFRNRGGSLFLYRLNLGALPYVDAHFPLGGKRGANVNVSLSGRNLDTINSTQVAIALDAAIGPQEMRVLTPRGFSNARPFVVGELPEFQEKEPNDTPTQTNLITLPVTINGKMDVKGDKDSFIFKVEKNQRVIFEANARRLGSPLDPFLTLFAKNGKELVNNDDSFGIDAMIDYTFLELEAGEYVIQVKDLTDNSGPDFAYRLTVSSPIPDFSLTVTPDNPRANPNQGGTVTPDNPRVHQGGSVALTVNATRQLGSEPLGYKEEIVLTIPDLPKGFSVSPAAIAPNQTQATLTITVPPDAPIGFMPITVIGTGTVREQRVTHQARPLGTVKQGNQNLTRPTSGVFLTIMESPEFLVTAIPVSLSLTQGKSTSCGVSATRKSGYTGAISLLVSGLPRGVSASQANIAENQNQATLTLTAAGDAAVGIQNIVVSGSVTINNQQVSTAAVAIPLVVFEAPFVLTVNPTDPTIIQGGAVVIPQEGAVVATVNVTRKGFFTGAIALSVEGLPEGITAAEASIAEGQSEGTILLTADQNAKPGSYKNVIVKGAATVNNQTITQPAAAVTLIVTAKSETASAPPSQ